MPRRSPTPEAATLRRLVAKAAQALTPGRRHELERERAELSEEERFWARQEYALSRTEHARKEEVQERLRAVHAELDRDRQLARAKTLSPVQIRIR
jgi:hypothetical protein